MRIGVGVTRENAHLPRSSRLRRGVCGPSARTPCVFFCRGTLARSAKRHSSPFKSWPIPRPARGRAGTDPGAVFLATAAKRRDETRWFHRLCSARHPSVDLTVRVRVATGGRMPPPHRRPPRNRPRAPLFWFKTKKEWGTRGAIKRRRRRIPPLDARERPRTPRSGSSLTTSVHVNGVTRRGIRHPVTATARSSSAGQSFPVSFGFGLLASPKSKSSCDLALRAQ